MKGSQQVQNSLISYSNKAMYIFSLFFKQKKSFFFFPTNLTCTICFMSCLWGSTNLVKIITQVTFWAEPQEGFGVLARNRTLKHNDSHLGSGKCLAMTYLIFSDFHFIMLLRKWAEYIYRRTNALVLSAIFYPHAFQGMQPELKTAFIITPYWQAKQLKKIKDMMVGAIVNNYHLLISSPESNFLFLSFLLCVRSSLEWTRIGSRISLTTWNFLLWTWLLF